MKQLLEDSCSTIARLGVDSAHVPTPWGALSVTRPAGAVGAATPRQGHERSREDALHSSREELRMIYAHTGHEPGEDEVEAHAIARGHL
jgi:hypothetical protein